jgi:catechol 2,3-dioxygenase-like lactoylglutathione lyase family enzyme
MFELQGIDHVALSVRDVERSVAWYIEVLGFERRHEGMWNGIPVFVGKGATGIALFPSRDHSVKATSRPRGIAILHLAFRTDRDGFWLAQRELKNRGIKFHFEDHEVAHSIYFRDPDGHELEITTYEVEGRVSSRA